MAPTGPPGETLPCGPGPTCNAHPEFDDLREGLADILFFQGARTGPPVPLKRSNYSPNSAVEKALFFLFPPILQLNPQAKNFFSEALFMHSGVEFHFSY